MEYEWTLKDAVFTKDKGTVFSCFACGGGSTMGYKLAGFDVLGCNEIDPKMMEAYRVNHNPKYSYLEPIQEFKLRDDLPEELYNLDILDGSPPCSSFSMAGNREKDWGKEKKFREGQADQVLDTLFFDFIDLAKKLQPKVVVAENVKGLLMGAAKDYVGRIGEAFDSAGYYVDKWLLDASKMGVPQRRERVFFVAIRKDLGDNMTGWTDMFNPMPRLDLEFNEKPIPFKYLDEGETVKRKPITSKGHLKYISKKGITGSWRTEKESIGGRIGTVGFGYSVMPNEVPYTMTASKQNIAYVNDKHYISDNEIKKIGTYPLDYDSMENDIGYLTGMSVPPVMTAQIAKRIYTQWLTR